jgi:hypothetical protein
MYAFLGIIAFAILAMAFFAPILWSRRDEFWRLGTHHDHLIPPVPRSYRKAR